MTSSAGEPTVFGLTYRQHDNRQMQQILRFYDSLPQNPTVRSAVYVNLVLLEKNLDKDTIERIKEWMWNGGNLKEFPILAPAPELRNQSYQGNEMTQDAEYSESSLVGGMAIKSAQRTEPAFVSNESRSQFAAEMDTDNDKISTDKATGDNPSQGVFDRSFESAEGVDALKECSICLETGEASELPATSKITSTCDHKDNSQVCFSCIQETIRTAVRDGAIHRIACPLCPSRLSPQEIKQFVKPEILDRYNYLVMKSTPGFSMCLGPDCGRGQVHETQDGAPPLMICTSCGFQTCVFHGLPWHAGQNCVEFDQEDSQIERLEADEATAKLLSGSSKICPTCKQGVTKEEGCDHLACRCGEQWCFVCLASWENIIRIGGSAHARTCDYHPARVRQRADQREASAAQMAELVHGGPVSEALERARTERNAARREVARSSAAGAAEKRMSEMKMDRRNVGILSDTTVQKKRVKLVPAWEER